MVERMYMATDSNDERGAQFGPFQTAGEAETQARMLGWRWVLCYHHTVIDDAIVDVKTRFYEIDERPLPGVRRSAQIDPLDVDDLRSKIVRAKYNDLMPMTDADKKFFEQYEQQMAQHNANLAPKTDGRSSNASDYPRPPRYPQHGH